MNQAEDNLLRELRENIEQDIEVYLEHASVLEHTTRRRVVLADLASKNLRRFVMKRFREYNTQIENERTRSN